MFLLQFVLGQALFSNKPPGLWYQNVSKDVNFDDLDVPKKITLAKIGFLTIFVQLRDGK